MRPDREEALLRQRAGEPHRSVGVGDWTLELRGSELAGVGYRQVELLRAVRPVVRDRDWNTVAATVVAWSSTAVGLTVDLRFGDDFAGTLSVEGSESVLTIGLVAEARRDCSCNRVGLVVLHSPTVAGTAVTARHTDGTDESGRWPVEISPHQPFRDLTGFTWEQDGLQAELRFGGDVFETEDQRNWTDASFKTYSTPLSRPFPVAYVPGQRVEQSVELRVAGLAAAPTRSSTDDVITVGREVIGRVPGIALAAALYPSPEEPLQLPSRRFESVLVELTGDRSAWPSLLRTADQQAAQLDCGLDVRVVSDDPDVVAAVAAELPRRTVRFSAFDRIGHITTAALWPALRTGAASRSIELVAGTRAHFTELNRRRADLPDDAPAYTFSLTPQMHATEIDHIVESLAMQRLVVDNAARLTGSRPLHVGPVTLARRFNAVATSDSPSPAEVAAAGDDALLDTDFAAAWTLASVAALSRGPVATLCYYEVAGPRGLQGEDGLRPTGSLLSQIAALRGRPIRHVNTPAGLAALVLDDQVLIANLSGRERSVVVHTDTREQRITLAPWSITTMKT